MDFQHNLLLISLKPHSSDYEYEPRHQMINHRSLTCTGQTLLRSFCLWTVENSVAN